MRAGRRRLARRSRVHAHNAQIKVRNAPSDDRINFLAGIVSAQIVERTTNAVYGRFAQLTLARTRPS